MPPLPRMRQWSGLAGINTIIDYINQTLGRVTVLEAVGPGINQLTGDVTAGPGSGSQAATIANDAVTNAKAANMAQSTIKGRAAGAGTGDPTDLTPDQVSTVLDGASDPFVRTSAAPGGATGADGPVSMSVLTSGTGATYTVPAGIYRILVRCQGGGGGGGGADGGASQAGCGSGGGGGSYVEKIFTVTPSQTFTYSIGPGGAGGLAGNNNGTAGGDTTFDNAGSIMTATGGTGGTSVGVAGTAFGFHPGGIGGAPSGGTWSHRGDRAQPALRLSGTVAWGGNGGNSPLGAGGAGTQADGVGGVGFAYGGGGGGAAATTTTDRAGGLGADGVIIVTEYN